MSYKFDALNTILNRLDNRETVTVNSLMNDLEISERTAYRYIQTLQVSGYPISYDRRKNTYAYIDGYSRRKPGLSDDEALALALSSWSIKRFIQMKLPEERSTHII